MTFFAAKALLAGGVLVLSALLSMAETALLSLSRLQLGRLIKAHPGRLDFWQKDPDRALASILAANSLTNVGIGVLAASLALDVEALWGFPFRWGGWLLPATATVLVILFGEILPKVTARIYTESLSLAFAGPVAFLSRTLGPLLQGVVAWTGRALSLLSYRFKAQRGEWNPTVIRTLLENSPLASPVRSLLNNLLDFGKIPVAEVMVPREEIFALDLALPRRDFLKRVLESGYSRVPVYRGSFDRTAGLIHAKDLLAYWRSEALIVLEDLIRPLLRVSPRDSLAAVLRTFQTGKNHMALAVDEQGRVQGLLTMEDALGAIIEEEGVS